jgi:hypothetical protein
LYTGSPPPDFRKSIAEADKADGFVQPCDQRALMFGQDRHAPAVTRPVVRVRQHGDRAIVLPCTSKPPSNPADFFELTPERVMWTKRPDDRRTFACVRYEALEPSWLRKPIGMMPQSARIELLQWLKQRV